MSTLSEEDICWLDIPMDDASSVGSIEGVRDLDAQRQHSLDLQWSARNPMFQRQSIQKLHHDEGLAFMFADFVDGANVGMV